MGVPKRDVNACEDFITTITSGLVVAAALSTFELNSVDDQPAEHIVPGGDMIWTLSSVERRDKLLHLCGQVYDRFVQFAFNSKISASTDSVYEYTMLLLHLCLFYAEFADGIREGDGDRVLRCWKYMLPIFSSSGNTNYACEAANLVVQQMYTLSPRLAAGDALSMYMVGRGRIFLSIYTWSTSTKLPKVPFGFWGQTSR